MGRAMSRCEHTEKMSTINGIKLLWYVWSKKCRDSESQKYHSSVREPQPRLHPQPAAIPSQAIGKAVEMCLRATKEWVEKIGVRRLQNESEHAHICAMMADTTASEMKSKERREERKK